MPDNSKKVDSKDTKAAPTAAASTTAAATAPTAAAGGGAGAAVSLARNAEISKLGNQLAALSRRASESILVSGAKAETKVLAPPNASAQLLHFVNCSNGNYTVATRIAKLITENCSNCVFTVRGPVLTSTIEVIRCTNVTLALHCPAHTLTIDESDGIEVHALPDDSTADATAATAAAAVAAATKADGTTVATPATATATAAAGTDAKSAAAAGATTAPIASASATTATSGAPATAAAAAKPKQLKPSAATTAAATAASTAAASASATAVSGPPTPAELLHRTISTCSTRISLKLGANGKTQDVPEIKTAYPNAGKTDQFLIVVDAKTQTPMLERLIRDGCIVGTAAEHAIAHAEAVKQQEAVQRAMRMVAAAGTGAGNSGGSKDQLPSLAE